MHNVYIKISVLALISILLFCVRSFGQASGISGKIMDDQNLPLTGVITELLNANDSSLTKVNVTDTKGNFSFENIKTGKYFLKTSLIGFTPYRSEAFSHNGTSEKILAAIKLKVSSITLSETTVSGIKPLVEVRSDKTVFNVENSINATGSTAYELLQKAPGVVVDNNDNIMLKGRGGVLVQINGKNTYLSVTDLADYLKSIQSTDVESIELISNPSSKYDAEGTAGIINIRLKKNKNYGSNGSVTLGYAIGVYSKYNTAISLNNRSKKFSVFTNYSNNWGERTNQFYLYREQNPYKFDASSVFRRHGLNHNYKTGMDYSMNSKNTIGVMVTGNYSDINSSTTSRNEIYHFNSNVKDSILKSDQTIKGHSSNINFNLNHHYTDTAGHDLITDFDFGYYDSNKNNYQPNIYMLPDYVTELSSRYYRSITPTTINIYTLKSDYTQMFLKGKLGIGYKVSSVKTDNTFNFYNIEGTTETINNIRSNRFTYTEKVYAGYLNYQRSIAKFDFQAGVRMENTVSEGDLKSASDTTTNKNVKRNYVNLFPSGGITYNLNKTNSFALIYSRRIDRPNYQELNPFEFILDELSFAKGNPFLKPQYSDKIELSHTYKYATTTSIGYSNTVDFFSQISDTLSAGVSYLTPRNLATEKVLSLDVSSSQQPITWYSVYFHLGLYKQFYRADFGQNKTINTSVTNFNFYVQNTFKLPAALSFEVSGWYNSAGIWGGSFVTKAQGSLDVGLQRKFNHDLATLKLSYTDILHTAPWSGDNVYGGIVVRTHGNWESQQFRISLNWRFGNKQVKGTSQRKTGSESELKRISGE